VFGLSDSRVADLTGMDHPEISLPAISTVHAVLDPHGLVIRGPQARRDHAEGTELSRCARPRRSAGTFLTRSRPNRCGNATLNLDRDKPAGLGQQLRGYERCVDRNGSTRAGTD
jgi:hypothetical protein